MILDNHLKEIIVGLLLGDGNMQTFSKDGKTWRLRIIQGGSNHFIYICHLRNLLDAWTKMEIKEYNEVRTIKNKIYKKWYFNTLSFEQFSELGNAFYPLINRDSNSNYKKRKKIIPLEIEDWLTDKGLAYWFMDDGSTKWGNKVSAIRFCTDSFTEREIDLLIDVINRKFNLKATKFINNNKWRLYFGTENYQQLKELIYPYIIPGMLYKFPL